MFKESLKQYIKESNTDQYQRHYLQKLNEKYSINQTPTLVAKNLTPYKKRPVFPSNYFFFNKNVEMDSRIEARIRKVR